MLAPCYRCPATFETAAEHDRHAAQEHPRRTVIRTTGRTGIDKTFATFLMRATTEQIRRLNRLAGWTEAPADGTCG